jgi:hypothetical protein
MNIEELDCWRSLPEEPATQLAQYRPTLLTRAEWMRLRRGVVCLVACCDPETELDARTLASTLTRFLAELRGEAGQLHTDLVTQLNVTRVLDG